ncbi:hypothetical protein BDV24DRAFT_139871 [Aspergillus arachidicola]|uniref:Uncharacterized protein n=1 Tax=Aspergillus arachidicola TaxID=656916 RepID=A0A5N6XX71_9EURO|nr:hypothetical protein BDV24DRAFT_139871 [Aspergillus arachidicola]
MSSRESVCAPKKGILPSVSNPLQYENAIVNLHTPLPLYQADKRAMLIFSVSFQIDQMPEGTW